MSKSTNFKNTVEWFSNPKIAISLGIMVLIAGVVLWFFWDKIRDAIHAAKTQHKLQQDASQYGAATLTDTQIRSLAEQIYRAMKGWGTNEAQVANVLSQLGNNADYAALCNAYYSLAQGSLDSRISTEGTTSELKQWRAILQGKGITIYTF